MSETPNPETTQPETTPSQYEKLPVGLIISEDGSILNWLGVNYVVQERRPENQDAPAYHDLQAAINALARRESICEESSKQGRLSERAMSLMEAHSMERVIKMLRQMQEDIRNA